MVFLRAAALLFLLFSAPTCTQADNTACSGSQMDWYTSIVGETPCKTYERLRQTCNAEYQVGKLSANTSGGVPPDFCDDQKSRCCCNSIAFALSMLCLNCQQAIGTGNGYDAGSETMEHYFNASTDGTFKSHCYTPTMHNFTADIQTAVCNQNIRIFDQLYPISWDDGSWHYVYTRDTIHQENNVAANNSFTVCPDTLAAASSSSAPGPTTTVVETVQSSPSLTGGAIAGIVFGVGLFMTGAALALFLFLRYRRNSRFGRKYGNETGGMTQIDGSPTGSSNSHWVVRPYSILRPAELARSKKGYPTSLIAEKSVVAQQNGQAADSLSISETSPPTYRES